MSSYIIKQGCSGTEYYNNLHKLYERARELSIEPYITGVETIPTDQSVREFDRPLLHFYQAQLQLQTQEAEPLCLRTWKRWSHSTLWWYTN